MRVFYQFCGCFGVLSSCILVLYGVDRLSGYRDCMNFSVHVSYSFSLRFGFVIVWISLHESFFRTLVTAACVAVEEMFTQQWYWYPVGVQGSWGTNPELGEWSCSAPFRWMNSLSLELYIVFMLIFTCRLFVIRRRNGFVHLTFNLINQGDWHLRLCMFRIIKFCDIVWFHVRVFS